MKYLFLLLLLSSCANQIFPEFPPQVGFQRVVIVKNDKAHCLIFEIVSKFPYKIKYIEEVPLSQCDGLGGFLPKEMQAITAWMDDVHVWAKDREESCSK